MTSTVYSGIDERKHQSSASLAFVREIHQWPVNSPHKGPVTQKMFPFDDVIMFWRCSYGDLLFGTIRDKSTLRRATSIGRPRSVYKSDVERIFLKFLVEMAKDLEGQGQWPPFSIPAKLIERCKFRANLVILAEIHSSACADMQNFLEFWVKIVKVTLKVKVNDPHFQY